MRFFLNLFTAATLLLSSLTAHAGTADTVILPKGAMDAPAETMGTVIGTIGFRVGLKEPQVTTATLVFRKIGSTDEGQIRFVRPWLGMNGNTGAVTDGEFRYAAFRMPLPEGQYELIRVLGFYAGEIYCHGDCGIKTGNEVPFSVPFEVKRGKVLYLGSFLAHGTCEMVKLGFIPMPYPTTVYLAYADKWQRDMSAFTSGGELAVDPALVEHAVLSVNARTGYYIVAEDHIATPKLKMRDVTHGLASFPGMIAAYKAAHPEDAGSNSTPVGSAASGNAAPAASVSPAASQSTATAATPAGS